MAKKVLVTKAAKIPKAKELKDITKQIEITTDSAEKVAMIFKYAVVELGRQIAKQWSGNGVVSAAGIAAQVNELINDSSVGFANSYQFRNMLSEEYGIQYNWTTVDNCGNLQSVDSGDLYEDTEVRIIIQLERKVKDAKKLADLGIK
jgi:hypothetical protein